MVAALRQIQLANIFVEIGLGRLSDAIDSEGAITAQVNEIAISFENLVLRELVLQMDGDQRFFDFAFPALVATEAKIASQLHC